MSGSTASAAYSGPPTINGITEVDADVLVITDGGTISYPDYPNTVLVVQADGTVVGVSEIDADQVPTTLRSTTFPSLVVVGDLTAASETVGSLTVTGTATIGTLSTASLALSGTLSVAGATTLAACSVSSLTCSGAATFNGFTTVNNDLLITQDVGALGGYFQSVYADDFTAGNNSSLAITSVTTFTATGPATMAAVTCASLAASGAVTVGSTLGVTGTSTLAALTCTTLAASGAVTVGGTLGVTGATTLATPVGINMAANTLRVLGVTATSTNTAVHAVATSSGTAIFSLGRATFTANGVSNSYFASSALNAFYSSTVAWGLNTDSFDLGIKLGNNSSSTAVNQFTQIRMEQRAGGLLDRPILDLQAVRTTAATGEVALAVTGRDTGMVSYTMRTSMMCGNQYCFFSPNASTGWVSMLSQIAPTAGYKFGVGPSGSTATHSELNGDVLVRGTASFNSTLSVLGASTMAAVSATTLTASDRIYSNYAAASQMVFTPGTAASTFIRVDGPAGGVNRRITFIDPGSADREVLYTDKAQDATLGRLTLSGTAQQLYLPGAGTTTDTQEIWLGQDAAGETQWRLLSANSSFGSNWRVRQRTGGVSNDRVIVSSAGTAIWSNLGIGKSPTANALDVLGATVLQALTCTTLAASGNATVGGTLGVTGATTLAAVTCTTLTTSGNVTVGGTLSVTGAVTFAAVACSTLAVSGSVTVGGELTVTGGATIGSTLSDTIEHLGCVRQILAEGYAPQAGVPRTYPNVNWCKNMDANWAAADTYIVLKIPIQSGQWFGTQTAFNKITYTSGDLPKVGDIITSSGFNTGVSGTVTNVSGTTVTYSAPFLASGYSGIFYTTNRSPWDYWRRCGAMLTMALTMRQYNTTNHGVYTCTLSMSYLTSDALDAFPVQNSTNDGMPGTFNAQFDSFRVYQPVGGVAIEFWVVFTHGCTITNNLGALIKADLLAPSELQEPFPYWTTADSLANTYTTVVTAY